MPAPHPIDRIVMAEASVKVPQACSTGLRHRFGIAAVAADVPLLTVAEVFEHAGIATIYTSAVGVETRNLLARMRDRVAKSGDLSA